MKVLPMQAPWANLVVRGIKTTETRGRHTALRGPVAILVTRTRVPFHEAPAAWQRLAEELDVSAVHLANEREDWTERLLQRGKVIGTVHIEGSVRSNECREDPEVEGWEWWGAGLRVHPFERLLGDYGPGRRVWPMSGALQLDQAVVCRGMPGIFTAPPDVAREVSFQVKEAQRRTVSSADIERCPQRSLSPRHYVKVNGVVTCRCDGMA